MKTIIAAFSDSAAAQQAALFLNDRLRGAPDARVSMLAYNDAGPDVVRTLTSQHVPNDRASTYAEALRRGATLLIAQAPDRNARELAAELDRLGSLDLDEAENRWRSAGWKGYETNALPFDAAETARERSALAGENRMPTNDLEVVEEQVQIGKRAIDRGGVRVRTFVIERPVEETIELKEERIEVEREQVDEPISPRAADSTFTEEEFVVTAKGEEAVVGKEARVVERVHVGKTEDTRTETIRETERRRDVKVEPIESTPPERRGPRH